MNLNYCEDGWVEVNVTTKSKITIACVYKYPKNNLTEFQTAFCKNIKSLKSQKYAVLGDLNFDYNMYNSATKIKQ